MWKIIVVEDNEMVRDSICLKIPWDTVEAEIVRSFPDGRSAWDYMGKNPVDLVISDIIMPLMSGIDLAQNVFQQGLPVKMILISAYNEFEYARNAIRFGVSAYVTKPIEHDVLLESVREALQELEESRLIQRKLEKSFPVIRNQFFERLLRGTMNKNTFENDCRYLNLRFSDGTSRCCLLEPDSLYEAADMGKRETILYTLEKITKQKLKQYDENAVIFVYSREQVVVLAHLAVSRKELYGALEWVRGKAAQRLHITVSAGIGTQADSIYEIGYSYARAKEALKQRFLEGGDKIFEDASERKREIGIPALLDLSVEQFCDRIKYDSREQVLGMLKGLEQALYRRESACQTAKSWLLYLGACLFRLWNETEEDEIIAAEKYMRFTEDISQQKTLKDSFRVFADQVMDTYEATDRARSSRKNSVVKEVVNFIGENYQDNGLSLDRIAESVYLSSSYVSSLFKKNTGQTITDYISGIRICQAKKLLVESDMKIAEISENTGYINQFYFSSCFKKVMGVSPQEFRNSAGRGEEK